MAVNDRKTRAELLKIIQECTDFPLEEQEQMADVFSEQLSGRSNCVLESLKNNQEKKGNRIMIIL